MHQFPFSRSSRPVSHCPRDRNLTLPLSVSYPGLPKDAGASNRRPRRGSAYGNDNSDADADADAGNNIGPGYGSNDQLYSTPDIDDADPDSAAIAEFVRAQQLAALRRARLSAAADAAAAVRARDAGLQEYLAAQGLGSISQFRELAEQEAQRTLEELQEADLAALEAQISAQGGDLEADWAALESTRSTTGLAKAPPGVRGQSSSRGAELPDDTLLAPPSNPRVDRLRYQSQRMRRKRRLFNTVDGDGSLYDEPFSDSGSDDDGSAAYDYNQPQFPPPGASSSISGSSSSGSGTLLRRPTATGGAPGSPQRPAPPAPTVNPFLSLPRRPSDVIDPLDDVDAILDRMMESDVAAVQQQLRGPSAAGDKDGDRYDDDGYDEYGNRRPGFVDPAAVNDQYGDRMLRALRGALAEGPAAGEVGDLAARPERPKAAGNSRKAASRRLASSSSSSSAAAAADDYDALAELLEALGGELEDDEVDDDGSAASDPRATAKRKPSVRNAFADGDAQLLEELLSEEGGLLGQPPTQSPGSWRAADKEEEDDDYDWSLPPASTGNQTPVPSLESRPTPRARAATAGGGAGAAAAAAAAGPGGGRGARAAASQSRSTAARAASLALARKDQEELLRGDWDEDLYGLDDENLTAGLGSSSFGGDDLTGGSGSGGGGGGGSTTTRTSAGFGVSAAEPTPQLLVRPSKQVAATRPVAGRNSGASTTAAKAGLTAGGATLSTNDLAEVLRGLSESEHAAGGDEIPDLMEEDWNRTPAASAAAVVPLAKPVRGGGGFDSIKATEELRPVATASVAGPRSGSVPPGGAPGSAKAGEAPGAVTPAPASQSPPEAKPPVAAGVHNGSSGGGGDRGGGDRGGGGGGGAAAAAADSAPALSLEAARAVLANPTRAAALARVEGKALLSTPPTRQSANTGSNNSNSSDSNNNSSRNSSSSVPLARSSVSSRQASAALVQASFTPQGASLAADKPSSSPRRPQQEQQQQQLTSTGGGGPTTGAGAATTSGVATTASPEVPVAPAPATEAPVAAVSSSSDAAEATEAVKRPQAPVAAPAVARSPKELEAAAAAAAAALLAAGKADRMRSSKSVLVEPTGPAATAVPPTRPATPPPAATPPLTRPRVPEAPRSPSAAPGGATQNTSSVDAAAVSPAATRSPAGGPGAAPSSRNWTRTSVVRPWRPGRAPWPTASDAVNAGAGAAVTAGMMTSLAGPGPGPARGADAAATRDGAAARPATGDTATATSALEATAPRSAHTPWLGDREPLAGPSFVPRPDTATSSASAPVASSSSTSFPPSSETSDGSPSSASPSSSSSSSSPPKSFPPLGESAERLRRLRMLLKKGLLLEAFVPVLGRNHRGAVRVYVPRLKSLGVAQPVEVLAEDLLCWWGDASSDAALQLHTAERGLAATAGVSPAAASAASPLTAGAPVPRRFRRAWVAVTSVRPYGRQAEDKHVGMAAAAAAGAFDGRGAAEQLSGGEDLVAALKVLELNKHRTVFARVVAITPRGAYCEVKLEAPGQSPAGSAGDMDAGGEPVVTTLKERPAGSGRTAGGDDAAAAGGAAAVGGATAAVASASATAHVSHGRGGGTAGDVGDVGGPGGAAVGPAGAGAAAMASRPGAGAGAAVAARRVTPGVQVHWQLCFLPMECMTAGLRADWRRVLNLDRAKRVRALSAKTGITVEMRAATAAIDLSDPLSTSPPSKRRHLLQLGDVVECRLKDSTRLCPTKIVLARLTQVPHRASPAPLQALDLTAAATAVPPPPPPPGAAAVTEASAGVSSSSSSSGGGGSDVDGVAAQISTLLGAETRPAEGEGEGGEEEGEEEGEEAATMAAGGGGHVPGLRPIVMALSLDVAVRAANGSVGNNGPGGVDNLAVAHTTVTGPPPGVADGDEGGEGGLGTSTGLQSVAIKDPGMPTLTVPARNWVPADTGTSAATGVPPSAPPPPRFTPPPPPPMGPSSGFITLTERLKRVRLMVMRGELLEGIVQGHYDSARHALPAVFPALAVETSQRQQDQNLALNVVVPTARGQDGLTAEAASVATAAGAAEETATASLSQSGEPQASLADLEVQMVEVTPPWSQRWCSGYASVRRQSDRAAIGGNKKCVWLSKHPRIQFPFKCRTQRRRRRRLGSLRHARCRWRGGGSHSAPPLIIQSNLGRAVTTHVINITERGVYCELQVEAPGRHGDGSKGGSRPPPSAAGHRQAAAAAAPSAASTAAEPQRVMIQSPDRPTVENLAPAPAPDRPMMMMMVHQQLAFLPRESMAAPLAADWDELVAVDKDFRALAAARTAGDTALLADLMLRPKFKSQSERRMRMGDVLMALLESHVMCMTSSASSVLPMAILSQVPHRASPALLQALDLTAAATAVPPPPPPPGAAAVTEASAGVSSSSSSSGGGGSDVDGVAAQISTLLGAETRPAEGEGKEGKEEGEAATMAAGGGGH
ncbi:hypothetical protein VOLCADRAFT_100088 [Volvox carteri f. nagariensis]|uniref:Uncharacterized protein n=1 Tax=Volvox carteri f. nagariensis TaxID=3068 RepID=D8UJE2_VOLCA|nr:uncharacterized protein VOLCADRAFT_100088 [Volvox carteri f. nagariensis]EFJ40173.1 hypothetical protein VOLCADRAFT_100088 [Volvox carteri f. nagariensis]|eukprot:XP_002958783.1 hypothetical protein VOLCADRAFT_100088 [Volvox carteri f. nagariensis]